MNHGRNASFRPIPFFGGVSPTTVHQKRDTIVDGWKIKRHLKGNGVGLEILMSALSGWMQYLSMSNHYNF